MSPHYNGYIHMHTLLEALLHVGLVLGVEEVETRLSQEYLVIFYFKIGGSQLSFLRMIRPIYRRHHTRRGYQRMQDYWNILIETAYVENKH